MVVKRFFTISHPGRPEQASTPHDIGELAGEMESPAPTCKPGYDEGTIRTCEKEPLIDSEGEFGTHACVCTCIYMYSYRYKSTNVHQCTEWYM